MKSFCAVFWLFTVCVFIVANSTLAQDIDSGLEAYWDFDTIENGVTPDRSGNGRDAVASELSPVLVSGVVGNALYFDGGTDLQTAWKGIGGTNARSISLWIKTTDTGKTFVTWGTQANGEQWLFGIRGQMQGPNGGTAPGPPPGTLSANIMGSGTFGRAFVDDGEWHHVVCVFEGDSVRDTRFYVDGVAEPSAPPPPPDVEDVPVNTNVDSNDSPGLQIGGISRPNGIDRIVGTLDDVRIYSRLLSDADIQALYALGQQNPPVATRSFDHDAVSVGETLQVTLTLPPDTSGELTETIPNDWTVQEIGQGGVLDGNAIVWMIGSGTNVVQYSIAPDHGAAGTRFVGILNGFVSDGDFEVSLLTEGAGFFSRRSDIGNVLLEGSSKYQNGTYVLNGSGAGVGGTADAFHFLFEPVSGPFVIRGNAFVLALDAVMEQAVGGLMVRNDLNEDSSNGFVYTDGVFLMSSQARRQPGGPTLSIHDAVEDQLGDMEIVRNGTVLEFFYLDSDGNRTSLGQTRIDDLADPVYAGLAVSSGQNSTVSELEFTDFELVELPFGGVRTFSYDHSRPLSTDQTLSVTVQVVIRDPNRFSQTVFEIPPMDWMVSNIQTSVGHAEMESGKIAWTLDEGPGSFELTYDVTTPGQISGSNETGLFEGSISGSETDLDIVGDAELTVSALLSPDELAQQNITTGLEGHWTFDEGSGSAFADSSGNGRNAETRNGTIGWIPGVQGTALEFDGESDVVVPGYYGISGNDPRTVSFWMRSSDTDSHAIVIWGGSQGQGVKWDIHINTGMLGGPVGVIRADIFANFASGTATISDDAWHHIAVVLPNGGTTMEDVELFVDGFPDATSGTDPDNPGLEINTFGPDNDGEEVMFGSRLERGEQQFYQGDLDEVRIYSRGLTPAEIQAIYVSERPIDNSPASVSDFMIFDFYVLAN